MNKVLIEWKHLDVGGETCDRCFDTGTTLQKEVRRLNDELQTKEVRWSGLKPNWTKKIFRCPMLCI